MPEPLKPHQQRVIAERDAVHDSRLRLEAFLDSETAATVPQAELMMLLTQSSIMNALVNVLNQRIQYWRDHPVLTLGDSIADKDLEGMPRPDHQITAA